MEIKIIPCLNDNYSYLIFDKNKKNACVIDPSESLPVIKEIEKNQLNLKYILNTHHHYDHVGGNKELKKKYHSKIVGFKDDKDRIPEIDILVENNQIWKKEILKRKFIIFLVIQQVILPFILLKRKKFLLVTHCSL